MLAWGTSTGARLNGLLALEGDVGEPLELGHLTVTFDVERQGDMIDLDVVHAAHKASADRWFLHSCSIDNSRAEEDIRLLQVQDIIVPRSSSVGPPLAVHADLGAVAVPLQLHLVPLTVAHHLVGQPHKALATSEVEPVLEMAIDNLHDAIIHLAFCVHDRSHLVSCPEAQAQTKMPLHRPLESVLGIAASGKCERVDDRALSLLAV